MLQHCRQETFINEVMRPKRNQSFTGDWPGSWGSLKSVSVRLCIGTLAYVLLGANSLFLATATAEVTNNTLQPLSLQSITRDSEDPTEASGQGTWVASTAVSGFNGANDLQDHAAAAATPIIIDNDDPAFSVSGNWLTSSWASGYQGADYRYRNPAVGHIMDNLCATAVGNWISSTWGGGFYADNLQYHSAGDGSGVMTWSQADATPGQYQLYARWKVHPNRATNAPFTITHSQGQTTVPVNQRQNGGRWVLLGTFSLDGNSQVSLSNQANGFVIADAIRRVRVNPAAETATWQVNHSGGYELYARWPAYPNHARNATYTITHSQGQNTVTVDQTNNGGQWNLLGTYTFDANSQVSLSDQADGYAIADALRLIFTGPSVTGPVVTVSAPADGSSFPAGTAIDFTASATDAEDGDLSASIDWSSDLDGPLGSGATLRTSTLSVGAHLITATVTDSGGLDGTDTLTVTITAVSNTPPVVTVNTPAEGSSHPLGAAVDFSASATDAEDGDLSASIDWSSDLDGALGSGATFSTSALSAGTHRITATVTDSGGLDGMATRTVNITTAGNTPPLVIITNPPNGRQFPEGVPITFRASAADGEDGDLGASLEWSSDVDGVLGNGAALTVDNLTVGGHTITATVLDSGGLTGRASRTLAIVAPLTCTPINAFSTSGLRFGPRPR